MPMLICFECECCRKRTRPWSIEFQDDGAKISAAARREAESHGWERVRNRTWYCQDCRRIRNSDGRLIARIQLPDR